MAKSESALKTKLRNVNLSSDLVDSLIGPEPEETVVESELYDSDLTDPDYIAHNRAVAEIAKNTPEVRFKDFHKFNDDEIKIIAAGLKSRTAIYRIADALQCSRHKVMNAINNNPVLKELALERIEREKDETEEAIDDCIKARVPAVIMWKAAKIMPEKYGDAVNIDDEDDTRIQIGAFSEEDVAEAEAIVSAAADTVPDVPTPAIFQAQEEAKALPSPYEDAVGAELAAGGAGIPAEPLSKIPPTPAVKPPANNPNYMEFIPGHLIKNAPPEPSAEPDYGQDNYGTFGGGEDYGDSSWI